ncbi:hypothetical protein ABZ714_19650 [Streptomyces sp. NPDC006798]|uniref:hypothetical protein n=1 Tax=Streptomyces sp. NPDC006798 TaxID=3155462 RepID=UPI0033F56C63
MGLPELVRLLLTVPWWHDCQAFTDEESRELEAEYLEDTPDLVVQQNYAAAALGLSLPERAEALSRLREIATQAGDEFLPILTSQGHSYEPLFTP